MAPVPKKGFMASKVIVSVMTMSELLVFSTT